MRKRITGKFSAFDPHRAMGWQCGAALLSMKAGREYRAPQPVQPPGRQGYGGATPVSGFVAFCLGQVPAPAGFPGIHPGIAIKREVHPGAVGDPSPVTVAWFFCSLG